MMMRRRVWLAAVAIILVLAGSGAALWAAGARAQEKEAAGKIWEYLIVAGGNVAFPSTGSPGRRKQDEFGREATTVERNLDRLGAEGWELVAVGGAPNDPVFYLKRAKSK